MSNSPWTIDDIGDQSGRVAVITGANSGIGYEAAVVLAKAGATVLMACRNPQKASKALADLKAAAPGADAQVMQLDLSSLESVQAFAEAVGEEVDHLDLLLNNAGIMMVPYGLTEDGFERQIGTNHLGHFALTGRLLPMLLDTAGARVVTVSSIAHRDGRMKLDDLFYEDGGYTPQVAYGQSKLSNLLFHYELQRRLAAHDTADTVSLACHPGVSMTNLANHLFPKGLGWLKPVAGLVLNSQLGGALPTLRAATDPSLTGGEYIGPKDFGEVRGRPVVVQPRPQALDQDDQATLWAKSLQLTGVEYPV